MVKLKRGLVLFRLFVRDLLLQIPVKILVQIIQFSAKSIDVFFSGFIGVLQGFFLGIQGIVFAPEFYDIKGSYVNAKPFQHIFGTVME